MRGPMVAIELAPGAEDNGLASMLADLVRQNLEAKPHKVPDFEALVKVTISGGVPVQPTLIAAHVH